MNMDCVADRLLTYEAAAAYMSLSKRQFRRVDIDSGLLPIVRITARGPRVRLSDVNACLESRTTRLVTTESE